MDDPSLDAPPPFLASWPRVYAAVLILELAVVAFVAAFSRWGY